MKFNSSTVPGYWMNETSGALRPAVLAYLCGDAMTDQQVVAMRAYLRQWINAPVWRGCTVAPLRDRIDELTSRAAIARWLADAEAAGIIPL